MHASDGRATFSLPAGAAEPVIRLYFESRQTGDIYDYTLSRGGLLEVAISRRGLWKDTGATELRTTGRRTAELGAAKVDELAARAVQSGLFDLPSKGLGGLIGETLNRKGLVGTASDEDSLITLELHLSDFRGHGGFIGVQTMMGEPVLVSRRLPEVKELEAFAKIFETLITAASAAKGGQP